MVATGDSTDRTAAIEAAAAAAQGGVLHFREGDYYLGSTIDADLSDIVIQGDPGARLVINAVSVLGFEFAGTAGTHLKNITVRGLTFYDADPAGHVGVEESHAIVAKYVDNLLVEDCFFEGMGDESIDAQYCENGTIRRNRFKNYAAASAGGGAIGVNNADGMNIESNWFEGGTQGNAIRVEVTAGSESAIGNRIVGNRILGHDGTAIAVTAGNGDVQGLVIAENRILDCTGVPISMSPSATFYVRDCVIAHNLIKGGGAEAASSPSHRGAIYCAARTEGTIIEGNAIRSWGTTEGHHGIVAVDAIIKGNRITAVADCGIRTQDDVAGSTVEGNHIYDSGTAGAGTRKAIHGLAVTKIRNNVASNNADNTLCDDMATAIPFLGPGSSSAWATQPSGKTEFRSTTVLRTKVDLSDKQQIRLDGRVVSAGATGAVLGIDYSTDESAWTTLATEIVIDATGVKDSGWVNLPAGAKADVFLRIYGTGGDASASPSFGTITAFAR